MLVSAPAQADTSPSPAPPSASVPAAAAPAAPTITKVTGGTVSGQLLVAYRAPASDGGSPVTSYEVTFDGGATWWPCVGVTGTCTLTSLTNGTEYTVALRAVNATGTGPSSVPATGTPSIPAVSDPAKPEKLPKPRAWVNASFNAASNGLGVDGSRTKLGVGTLPKLTFTRAIPDKASSRPTSPSRRSSRTVASRRSRAPGAG